jgi:hypothetical protein
MSYPAMPRIVIEQLEFFSHPTRTRFPFRYGIASMTEVPHVFARVRARVDDRGSIGLASEGLPPKWFTKDPGTTFEEDLPVMLGVIRRAAENTIAAGNKPSVFFEWWRELHSAQCAWADETGIAPLLAHLGVSLCERAVLDALCRALDRPVHRVVLENQLGLKLAEIHPELGHLEPADLLPPHPLRSVTVRHTLGLTDPLTPADIPEADRVRDGLPQDLESCLRAYKLRAFKVKLWGDPTRDIDRLRKLQALLARGTDGGFLITLDGNENFHDFAAFRQFWELLRGEPEVAVILKRTVMVEQPVHRSRALNDEAGPILEAWPDRPSLIIDESDGAVGDLPRALALGYAGTSHKNCKGIVKGIAHACLLAQRRHSNLPGLLSGEDLCNLGPVALLQDFALVALLGIHHVERNGHHYFRGLTPWPDDWQEMARAAHPDLFIRDPGGFVRVDVAQGEVRLGSINQAPFGLQPLLEPSRFSRLELQAAGS